MRDTTALIALGPERRKYSLEANRSRIITMMNRSTSNLRNKSRKTQALAAFSRIGPQNTTVLIINRDTVQML
jgi:hypothetical protein